MLSTLRRLPPLRLVTRPAWRSYRPSLSRAEHATLDGHTDSQVKHAWFFVDSIFPVRFGTLDFRHYIGIAQKDQLLGSLSDTLHGVNCHGFEVLDTRPSPKDGGVFVHFKYLSADPQALSQIKAAVEEHARQRGGIETWLSLLGVKHARLWLVKGSPWIEDMNRHASPILKVAFEGPDVHQEVLYDLLRPYGRLMDMTPPSPVPAGALRFSTVSFNGLHSATVANNCLYGFTLQHDGHTTRLQTSYERPLQAHAIRDWLTSHPRIVLPVAIFLLGTLTYTVFDPIRVFFVQSKMLHWFDYRGYTVVKWLRRNTLERFSFGRDREPTAEPTTIWKDRQDAGENLKTYLAEFPSTVTFIHGPQGSGKTGLVTELLREGGRRSLVIDCGELYKASSDSALVESLASQTGYRPIFTFLNSMNNLIDLASMGLIGQKTGLSATLDKQLNDILEVVATGLKNVSTRHRKDVSTREAERRRRGQHRADERLLLEKIQRGAYHDGRIDCVAGNGVMCELGMGDEPIFEQDWTSVPRSGSVLEDDDARVEIQVPRADPPRRGASFDADPEDVKALPVVIIKNFATRGSEKEAVLDALAEWAAALVENQIAHVIVLSDNRENSKRLAKALPAKPLASIALSDADSASARSFVTTKLAEVGYSQRLESNQTAYVEMLGGRASDLQALVRKVRSGQKVEEAVEDIVARGVSELRKNAFGDDLEDAKGLSWTREQAWTIVRHLSKKSELPYYDVLLEFPFKGDETALRSMEHAELIAITTREGRPSTIRPGRPVYKYVFERLVGDGIFRATQEIAFNEKAIAVAQSSVESCETELLTLKELSSESASRKTAYTRARYVAQKMHEAQAKIEKLEATNAALHKCLLAEL